MNDNTEAETGPFALLVQENARLREVIAGLDRELEERTTDADRWETEARRRDRVNQQLAESHRAVVEGLRAELAEAHDLIDNIGDLADASKWKWATPRDLLGQIKENVATRKPSLAIGESRKELRAELAALRAAGGQEGDEQCVSCPHRRSRHGQFGCMAEIGHSGSGSVADAVFCQMPHRPGRRATRLRRGGRTERSDGARRAE